MSSAANRRKKTATTGNESPESEKQRRLVKKSLPALLFVVVLGNVLNQAFNLVFQNIGTDLHMSASASLLATLPGIVLAVACMVYDTLCDFISPRRMIQWGVGALIVASVVGFFFSGNFWVVLVVRMVQSAGAQVTGSVFVVMAVKYLAPSEKVVYLGVNNAIYFFACMIGVVAGGFIEMIPWKFLLLSPALAVVVLPLLLRNIPDVSGTGEKVDAFGITVFGLIAALVVVYFSFPSFWWLVAAAVLAVVFGFYVAYGSHPFLTRKLLGNLSFLGIIAILFVAYFFQYACVPIYQVMGGQVYRLSLMTVSLCLAAVYLVQLVMGLLSGPIVNKIGRYNTIFLSVTLMTVGFGLSALLTSRGFWLMLVLCCVYDAGITIIYSPMYDAAAAALPAQERGRSVAICDLMINVSPAIGIAVYSALLGDPSFGQRAFPGVSKAASQVSDMFWLMFLAAVAALALTLAFRKRIDERQALGAGAYMESESI